MPIYEYICRRCGQETEVFHKMSESPSIDCDRCDGVQLERLVSAAGFRLKGSGWYETDFKNAGKRKAADAAPAKPAADSGAGADKPSAASSTCESKSSSNATA